MGQLLGFCRHLDPFLCWNSLCLGHWLGCAAGQQQVSVVSSDIEECRAHPSEQREGSSAPNEDICATAVDMHREGRFFFPYRHGVRALAIACSWQGTSSSWLRRRAGNGGWLTAQPSPPFLPATSTGQQISERKKRTKPFIIHSCFSTDSLFAHLDRAENNSMQKEGQEVQAAQVGGLSVPEFSWDHHWAWCGLLWHGSKLVWVLGKDTHYLHFSSNRSEHWYDVI